MLLSYLLYHGQTQASAFAPLDVSCRRKSPTIFCESAIFEPFAVVENREDDLAIPRFFLHDADTAQPLAAIFQRVIDNVTEYPEKGQPLRRDLRFEIRYDSINLKDDPFNFSCNMRLDDYSDAHGIGDKPSFNVFCGGYNQGMIALSVYKIVELVGTSPNPGRKWQKMSLKLQPRV